MPSTTAALSPYIEKIIYEYECNEGRFPRERIFDYGIAHEAPVLERGHTNRILVYPGSFNPPHNGHVALLRQALNNSGSDVNIIAAIILPLDDNSLHSRLARQPGTLIFTQKQRATLWAGEYGTGPGPSCWVFEYSTKKWGAFQKQLIKTTASDDFNVEFVCLLGPDWVKVAQSPRGRVRGCEQIIVSDVGRSAEFIPDTISNLTQLRGCERWEEVLPDFEALRRRAEEDDSWVYSGLYILRRSMRDFGKNSIRIMI